MSLINQMLRDLEARSLKPVKHEALLAETKKTSKTSIKLHHNKFSFLFSIIFLISVVIFISFQTDTSFKPVATPSINLFPMPFHANQKQKDLSLLHLTPSILTGITFQVKDNVTSLNLSLSQGTLYTVHESVASHTLTIVLDNARLVMKLPYINTLNSAINKLEIHNLSNGNVSIVLNLVDSAELKTLYLNEANKLPELQIEVYSNPVLDHHSENNKAAIVQQDAIPFKKLMINMDVGEQYQQALHFYSIGQLTQAIQSLTDLVNHYPYFSPARESLALLFFQQHQSLQAEKIINQGLEKNPSYSPFIEMKAKILMAQGKEMDALHLLKKYSPSIEEYPEYYALIAAIYQREGLFNSAIHLYQQLLMLQPNNATWWVGLGISLDNIGKPDQALIAYQRADKNNHLNPDLKSYIENRINSLT